MDYKNEILLQETRNFIIKRRPAMKIEFTKMHGCGNDYVYINGFTQRIEQEKKKDFVIRVSDRHFGIGSDGVIFINPSEMFSRYLRF